MLTLADEHALTYTLTFGLFLPSPTGNPGALLCEESDQSSSADPSRRKKRRGDTKT